MSKVVNKELRQDIPAARTGTTIKRYSPSTIDDPDHPFCLPIRSRVGFITGSAGSQDHHKNWFNVLAVGHPPQSEFPQGRASVAVSASFMGDIQLLWPTIDQRFVLFLQRFAHSGRRTEVPRLTICSKKSSCGRLSPFHGERAAGTEPGRTQEPPRWPRRSRFWRLLHLTKPCFKAQISCECRGHNLAELCPSDRADHNVASQAQYLNEERK